jgi:broad specificity phosphatase PhoE
MWCSICRERAQNSIAIVTHGGITAGFLRTLMGDDAVLEARESWCSTLRRHHSR